MYSTYERLPYLLVPTGRYRKGDKLKEEDYLAQQQVYSSS